MTLDIERRVMENVTRTKHILGTKTHYEGMRAKLVIHGVSRAEMQRFDKKFNANHFIQEISYNSDNRTVTLKTSFRLELILEIEDNFKIELVDLSSSDFGKGVSWGKHGFTKLEWESYIRSQSIK